MEEQVSNGADKSQEEKPQTRTLVISRLKAGEQPFLAWGYSYLKVMQDEEEIIMKLPIKSIGVAETMDRLNRKAPQPPMTRKFIKPGSEEARALGITSPRMVENEDRTDEKYKEATRIHAQNMVYEMILAGLAVDIEDSDGKPVIKSNNANSATEVFDMDKAIAILKSQGLSNEHLDQLYEDIQSLTKREKERVDRE